MSKTTISEALKSAKQSLSKNVSGILETEILLAYVLQKPRSYLLAWPDELLDIKQANQFAQLITRRKDGEPIAYIIGEKEFWSLPIKVSSDTLIPRAETERLIEVTLKRASRLTAPHILDLGTGSGCIALALAKELPGAQISACDRSQAAIEIAQENAKTLQLNNIEFYLSDWFTDLPEQTYDVIVSNPPYIAIDDPHLYAEEIQYEPQSALASGEDGLDDIRVIAKASKLHLSPSGILILEIGHNQASPVLTILTENLYQDVTFHRDLLGHQRICSARNHTSSA